MNRILIILCFVFLFVTGCTAEQQTSEETPQLYDAIPNVNVIFDGAIAPLIAADDEYFEAFSTFDYAGKFKSSAPLDYNQRLKIYENAIEPYTDGEKQKIQKAFEVVKKGLNGIKIKVPDQIIIFSDSVTESGEAYTRKNAICLPKKMVNSMSDKKLAELLAHETFHILSRYNQEEREKWYAILGYKKTNEVVWPTELKTLILANPDAAHNNYVITCQYKGKGYDFVHILYSDKPYDLNSKKSFFRYLKQEMMAVEVIDGTPKPLYIEGKPMLVKKSDLSDFTSQIGKNTKYTIHPEEITADHFALLVMGTYKNKPNPEKIEMLNKYVFQVQ